MEVLSTITSPMFSELVIVLSSYMAMIDVPKEDTLVEALRRVNEGRPFKLVFMIKVPDRFQREARLRLVEALDSMTAKGLLDFLDAPPIIR
jgi:glycerophosphoryl diester phosphodiesterase